MSRYGSPSAFRAAFDQKVKSVAKQTGRLPGNVRREYLVQRFLARVYHEAGTGPEFVLLGGSALLARQPGARHSKDVDFAAAENATGAGRALIEHVSQVAGIDPFRFDVSFDSANRPDKDHVRLTVGVFLGATEIERFGVDVTTRSVATVEWVQAAPIIEIDDVDGLPVFCMVPLVQQIADKLCAMYGKYGDGGLPSSRYRDLADLIVITGTAVGLSGIELASTIAAEQQGRGLVIPPALPDPSPQWASQYDRQVGKWMSLYPIPRYREAMTRLRVFAGPLLFGEEVGLWVDGQWRAAGV